MTIFYPPLDHVFSFHLSYKQVIEKWRTMTVTMQDNPYCWNFHTCSTLRNKELHLQARALTKKIHSSVQTLLLCHFPCLQTLSSIETNNTPKMSFLPKKYCRNFLHNLHQYLFFIFFFLTIIYCPSHSTAFSNFFPKPRFLTCSYLLQETERPTIPQAFKNTWEFWTFPYS